ncbi:MAG: hypothetical protein RLZZ126_1740 [Pseudomonadota bacterium]|jgi:glutathione S-transferase
MLKIWGRISSINVKKVVWAAQELGLPFERTEAGGPFGVVSTPDYQRLNPNALVPLIEDEGFVLWESNAIVRYLTARHTAGSGPGALYPTDLRTRFDAERWMDWQQTSFNPAGRDAFVQLVRTPENQRDLVRVRASVAATERLLGLFESALQSSTTLQASAFSMAHIPMGCEIHRWWGLPHGSGILQAHPRERFPRVDAWFEALRSRPAARGVLDLSLA